MNIYYKIWVDTITVIRGKKRGSGWKYLSILLISFAMFMNLFLLSFVIHDIGITETLIRIKLTVFGVQNIDKFISFSLLYLLPQPIINYLLIFHNDRYKKLLEIYPSQKGVLFIRYILISIILPIIYFWIAVIIAK